MQTHTLDVIATVKSCYQQKFGIPKQPLLASAATASIELEAPYAQPDAFRGLEEFSHIWVVFIFHACSEQAWRPLVRPPRLGGNVKKGVFATRAPYRPNSLGMSVVKLESVSCSKDKVVLEISAHDLVDGTPVVDIKPYLPYADAVEDAKASFAQDGSPNLLDVSFTEIAQETLKANLTGYPQLETLIRQVIAQDPRPAYKTSIDKDYAIHLYDFNIRWSVSDHHAKVLSISAEKFSR